MPTNEKLIVILLVLIKKVIYPNYIMDNNKLSSLAFYLPENKFIIVEEQHALFQCRENGIEMRMVLGTLILLQERKTVVKYQFLLQGQKLVKKEKR